MVWRSCFLQISRISPADEEISNFGLFLLIATREQHFT